MTDDRVDRFTELVRAHHRQVLAYARRRLGDWPAAEDLAAETFAVAWRRLRDVPAEPLPWLYRVAHGLLRNEYRRAAHRRAAERRAVEDHDDRARDPGVQVVEADLVVRALSGLAEPDRELLMLVGWEGLSVAEAARALAVPAAVVSVRLHRARRRLARRLADDGSGDRSAIPDRTVPDPAPELRRA
jgi:RNA polymerase sigma-70 factor (ECF subfamily)